MELLGRDRTIWLGCWGLYRGNLDEASDSQDGNLAPRQRHHCRCVTVAQGGETVLSVAARRSSVRCDCRVGGRPASASLAFKGRATAVAFDVHLEDGGVMNEAVDDSDRHCLVPEHGAMPQ
jgi:hypothetical protein